MEKFVQAVIALWPLIAVAIILTLIGLTCGTADE